MFSCDYIFLPQDDNNYLGRSEYQHMVVSQVEKELAGVARRSTQSLLRQRYYNALSSLDFVEIVEEMKLLCPTTFNILAAMIQFTYNEDKKTAPLALIYSIIMFKRCHEMSRVQRVNSIRYCLQREMLVKRLVQVEYI